MLDDDDFSIATNNSVKRRLAFDGEAGHMNHSRSLAGLKLVAEERKRRKALGLPTTFAFYETFTEDDIQRELEMGRTKKRKNPPKTKVRATRDDEEDNEVREEFVLNDDWENGSPFAKKKNEVDDRGEEVGANVTPRDLSGTDIDCPSRSSNTPGSETDLSTWTREKLEERFDDQQEEIRDLRKQIEELIQNQRKKQKKCLPEAKTRIDKVLLKEMKVVLKQSIIHLVTNQPKHWEVYDKNPKSMCQLIMSRMDQWPVTYSDVKKEETWKDLLGPRLNREWSLVKNEVVGKMKTTFLGKIHSNGYCFGSRMFNQTCVSILHSGGEH